MMMEGGRRICIIFVGLLSLLTTEAYEVGLTVLNSAVAKGAVCLDGSAPAYHIDKGFGAGIDNWLVFFEGGGWCNNATTCLERKDTRLGSSKKMLTTETFSGMFHNKAKYNPDFHDWNRIKVRYCDGSSFTGDVEAVDPKTNLHYRGARIFRAVIEDLLAKGMKNAKNAMLAGCSAGGLTAILQCDNFRSLLPATTNVKCLADAGFFINGKTIIGTNHIEGFYADVVRTHGSAKVLSPACTSKMSPGLCFFPQNMVQYIKTPIFLINAAYDSWQIKNILAPGVADRKGTFRECKLDITKCSAAQLNVLQGFREEFLRALTGFGKSPTRGLFINSCYSHCQTGIQETWLRNDSPLLGGTMGSSTSKSVDPEAAVVGRRSFSRNVFQTTSCIRPPSGCSDIGDDNDDEQVSDHQPKENGMKDNHSNMSSSKSKGRLDRNKHVKTKRADKQSHIPSETRFGEWGESSLSGTVSRNGSGSSRNPSRRFLSHFSFLSGNLSSRSSKAYAESSTNSVLSNDDNLGSSRFSNKTRTRQGCEIFPSCFMPSSPGPQDNDSDSGSGSGSGSDISDLSSIHELDRNGNYNNGMEPNQRYGGNGRMEAREPNEQNVRFSRTLSVGRLRDRVLNRPTCPELASLPLQPEHEIVIGGVAGEAGSRLSNENVMIPTTSSSYSSSTVASSLYGNHDLEADYMGARETSYPNLLEHRANFLERRRRIRSQVHALQRMGNRFENLSGHERSCILSGQHRTGHCTCRLSNQDPNNARGSISRIVLLAEALSEVLDEIHQQSVFSTSRHALSSIGSVPAPTEVVESLPVKLYRKLSKHPNEEDAQCYICLVEYEDGDEVRVLPCHHEFHRLCIDKWLKEIHRICPLCRGDVCKTASPADGLQL